MSSSSFLSRFFCLLLVVVVLLPSSTSAIKDTIKNRMKLADQYIAENPVEDGVEAMAR